MVVRNYYCLYFFVGVDISMDTNMITYLACICFIFIFGRIFILPLKKILKLIFNSFLGGVCIYIINLIGANFGFHIGLNFFTSILIRITRTTRSSLLDCREVANWIGVEFVAMRNVPIATFLFNGNRFGKISWFIHI